MSRDRSTVKRSKAGVQKVIGTTCTSSETSSGSICKAEITGKRASQSAPKVQYKIPSTTESSESSKSIETSRKRDREDEKTQFIYDRKNLEKIVSIPNRIPTEKSPFRLMYGIPSELVKNALVKPSPAVVLDDPRLPFHQAFYVKVTVVKNDELQADLQCLGGIAILRIENGQILRFEKLKITRTSQQIGCKFRFKFQLFKHENLNYRPVSDYVIFSEEFTVFSHKNQMTE
jgi:hypothetical protein